MALRSEVVNTSPRVSRAVAHVLWAVASWARRKVLPEATRIQVTLSYVMDGAGVGRKAAETALALFRRWTGVEGKAGWMEVSPVVLEAVWEALEWVRDQGLLHPPEVIPAILSPLFQVTIPDGRTRGKTRCGCEAHARGDRHPSLAFDLVTGMGTCMVSREVFVLRSSDEIGGVGPLVAHRISRAVPSVLPTSSEGYIKDTPPVRVPGSRGVGAVGGGEWGEDLSRSSETSAISAPKLEDQGETQGEGQGHQPGVFTVRYLRELEKVGRPGKAPRSSGTASGRLWYSGIAITRSQSRSRAGWFQWQGKRWSGKDGEAMAWDQVIHEEKGGRERVRTPDRLVGVGWWSARSIQWVQGPSGRRWPEMTMEGMGTGHVLLDLDGTPWLPGTAPAGMVDKIREALEGFGILDRVEAITRTSSHGLQVLVRLRRFRWDVEGFYRSPEVRRFLQVAADRVIAILGGGTADPSAWAPRRFGRAPGWRVKDHSPELASLWYAAPSSGKPP